MIVLNDDDSVRIELQTDSFGQWFAVAEGDYTEVHGQSKDHPEDALAALLDELEVSG